MSGCRHELNDGLAEFVQLRSQGRTRNNVKTAFTGVDVDGSTITRLEC
jgi:hypothetical protein